jgi:hypothetical protein
MGSFSEKYCAMVLLLKSVTTLKVWLKLDKNNTHCAGGPTYICYCSVTAISFHNKTSLYFL